jgi:CheY-like chemotaxis protein
VTALTSHKFEDLALAAGCDAFLSKPVLTAALIGELVRQIARRAKSESQPDMSRLARER